VTSEPAEACRVDVWLWRARFFKTRSLAARAVEEGGVRLTRGGVRIAVDKPSRAVRAGDVLVFPVAARWLAVRIEALGARRGPASEARALYRQLDDPAGGPPSAA
jgi:ribosome-associated heat shock protein Hsp15